MSDKQKSAELILQLYELRREPVMRQARQWFASFNPESAQDVMKAASGEHSAYYRMVTTYWDMACSLVNHGAIDEEMFNDANGEHNFIFAKIQPFIEEIRATVGPKYLPHLQKVVMRQPDIETRLAHLREMSKRFAASRTASADTQAKEEAATT